MTDPQPVPAALVRMHAQLVLAARRESWVGDVVAASFGQDARTVLAAARRSHPAAIPDDLSGLAGPQAHLRLQRLAGSLLAREAAGHRALMLLHRDDAEVRLRLASFEHGVECGRELASLRGAPGPGGVLDALADHVLEDLPCDPQVVVLAQSPRSVSWIHQRCPYRAAWADAGATPRPACQIMSAWIRGLASGLDGTVEYRRPKSIALGDDRCEHELVRVG